MTLTTKTEITDDEAKLYDRQIRLWGVNAQKQLRRANVLLVGFCGSGGEIAKNIILSGIQRLYIIEHEAVTEMDTLCSLFSRHQLSQNRARAAEADLRKLNPMVDIDVQEINIEQALEARDEQLIQLLQSVNVVCINNHNARTIGRLNALLRELRGQNTRFYATCGWGYYAFSFSDLGVGYKYLVEEVNHRDVDIGEETARKRLKTEAKEKPKEFVEKVLDFVPFDQMLQVKAGKPGFGLTRRTNPTFVLVHVMFKFYQKFGRYPQYSTRTTDQENLHNITLEVLTELGLDHIPRFLEKLTEQDCWNNVFGEISPVAAILGGVIAQDIIRTIAGHDPPIKNVFLFNGFECSGSIESIGR